MKPKHGALCIGIILAIIATILLIALPSSANLYVAYGFCLLGIAIMVAGVFAADIKNIPASYAVLHQTAGFLPASLILSIIVLALQGFKVFALPTIWHVIVQVVLLAITSIKLIGIFSGKSYIDRIDRKTESHRFRLITLIDDVITLKNTNVVFEDAEQNKINGAINQVIEALRYSDPISTGAVFELDTQIEEQVKELKVLFENANVEAIMSACTKICAKISDRNARLKASK